MNFQQCNSILFKNMEMFSNPNNDKRTWTLLFSCNILFKSKTQKALELWKESNKQSISARVQIRLRIMKPQLHLCDSKCYIKHLIWNAWWHPHIFLNIAQIVQECTWKFCCRCGNAFSLFNFFIAETFLYSLQFEQVAQGCMSLYKLLETTLNRAIKMRFS
jgi:hypothetical protein